MAQRRGGDPAEPYSRGAKEHLPAAALRALAEALERRQRVPSITPQAEISGRSGPDPVRHGDWEKNGIACDF